MDFSCNLSSFAKEHSEIICGMLDVKGIIPIAETVTDIINEKEYTIKKNIFNIAASVLSSIPTINDLTALAKKSCITTDSEQESVKKMSALKKAEIMASLFSISNGKAITGATGLSNNYLHNNLNYIQNDIKRISLSKEYIVTNPKIVGKHIDEEVLYLRICTDGKVTKLMKTNHYYHDKNHKKNNKTSCYGKSISADQIPYIVVPLGEDYDIYRHSVGAIIDSEGNYLHCVVAERGPKDNGMGEVSIYAAWKMKKLIVPPPKKEDGSLDSDYIIGNEDQKQDNGAKWRIVVFQKSAPDATAKRCGWHYKIPEAFRMHIYNIGKKYYKGTGERLYTKEDYDRDKKILKKKKALKNKQKAKRKKVLKNKQQKKQNLKKNIRSLK